MKKKIIRISSLLLVIFLMVLITEGVLAAPLDPNAPKELPLGSTPTTDPGSTGSSSNLDLQISGNSNNSSGGGEMGGMDQMMGMMGMDGMMGMNNMNNSGMNGMNNGGTNGVNPAVLNQLQASNSMILQMLSSISSQPNNNILQPQIQVLYQMLANQTALIQMLYSNSMNMQQAGMGNMGGMGMM